MALTIREYVASDGRNPFREWLASLEVATRARIQARVFRFEMGNLGDHKSVGAGVWEARLAFGPGYRIYSAGTASPSSCSWQAARRPPRRATSVELATVGMTTWRRSGMARRSKDWNAGLAHISGSRSRASSSWRRSTKAFPCRSPSARSSGAWA